jgi:hypothetical protein
MAISTRVSCDFPGCSEERKESNHWFLLSPVYTDSGLMQYIEISPFTLPLHTKGDIILCGEGHLSQWVAANAATLHAPPTPLKG